MHQYIRTMMEWNYSHWHPTNASGAVTADQELLTGCEPGQRLPMPIADIDAHQ
jgi:hypothetical protein